MKCSGCPGTRMLMWPSDAVMPLHSPTSASIRLAIATSRFASSYTIAPYLNPLVGAGLAPAHNAPHFHERPLNARCDAEGDRKGRPYVNVAQSKSSSTAPGSRPATSSNCPYGGHLGTG